MRLLIVDDDRNVLKDLENWAKEEGLEVVAVNSGVEAIRILESDPNFDIAFVDLIMPGLHGLDTMHGLHKIKKDLPVFLMANPREMKLAEKGVKIGASGIINKPISYDVIEKAIKEVFDKKAQNAVRACEIDPVKFSEILQIVIDTPASESVFGVLEREIKSRFPVLEIKVWSLSRETKMMEGIYPEGLPQMDFSSSNEYPDLIYGSEISQYIPGEEEDNSYLVFLKKRGKTFGMLLVTHDGGLNETEAKILGQVAGIVIHWMWLEDSLSRSIDLQAKAEVEAEELRSKLSRAVALMEKMKKHMKK